MSSLSEKILKMRQDGASYNEIAEKLKCSKSTISYHCGEGQKSKTAKRQNDRRRQHPFVRKVEMFKGKSHTTKKSQPSQSSTDTLFYKKIHTFQYRNAGANSMTFNAQDVINKFGENPKCYLTGDDIDIQRTSTYQFDHKIPISRGGDNSLDNLGICTTQANQSKRNQTPDEFIFLCKKILEHNGYSVTKE